MLTPQTIQTVQATAPVVAEHAEQITRRFYTLMFAGNPEVKRYFNQAHQHSGGQQKALAGAICAYAANIDNLEALGPAVDLIAHKHCSLGILPEHYPIVGKHLLAAIQDVLGEAASEEVLAAWAEAYGVLADVLIQHEAGLYDAHEAAPGGWRGYREFVVARKAAESEIVTSFYLRPADGGPPAPFLPGQYLTVNIEHPTTPTSPRNYSLSDRPGQGHYRISVKREPRLEPNAPDGLISNHLHDRVDEGDTLLVGPPCGNFTLDPAAPRERPLVLISGGVGVTPLLSMLKSVAHEGVRAPVYFIHGARNSRVHAFAREARAAAAEHDNIHAHFRYDEPLPGDLEHSRCDSAGVIDMALLDGLLPTRDADYYFCGPRPLMAAMYDGLTGWGVDPAQIHFEFFGPRQELGAA